MSSTFPAHCSRVALVAALCALVLPAQAADVKPAAESASQAKTKKAGTTSSKAKPTKGTDGKTVNNNPAGKVDDGSNLYCGKKPSGPKLPENAAQPAAK